MPKLQAIKKKVVRHSPTVVAIIGAAGAGAFVMNRYYDNMNHLVSVHSAVAAMLKNEGGALIFKTPTYGSFVLAPIQKV